MDYFLVKYYENQNEVQEVLTQQEINQLKYRNTSIIAVVKIETDRTLNVMSLHDLDRITK